MAHAQSENDPFERVNRRMYAFNAGLDRAIIRPLSKLTHGLTPGPIGRAIHNAFQNLNEPVVFINDLFQLKVVKAGQAATRLVINTTVGLLGTADVAKGMGLPHHPNGFGDTLGHYGAKPGPYLYLPVAGPYDLRDLVGTIVDIFSNPLYWVRYSHKEVVLTSLSLVSGLNERAEADHELDDLLSTAADPYATLRAAYLQAREGQIRGETASPLLPDIGPADVVPPTPAVESGAVAPGADIPPSALDAPPPPDSPAPATAPSPDASAPAGGQIPPAPTPPAPQAP